MPGTKAGAAKAAATIRRRYGKDYFALIGAEGGKASGRGGFAAKVVGKDGLTGKERARIAGAKGGKISKGGGRKKVSL